VDGSVTWAFNEGKKVRNGVVRQAGVFRLNELCSVSGERPITKGQSTLPIETAMFSAHFSKSSRLIALPVAVATAPRPLGLAWALELTLPGASVQFYRSITLQLHWCFFERHMGPASQYAC
jgi:hypothetical protein